MRWEIRTMVYFHVQKFVILTFSSGLQFMNQLLNRFRYAEVIFGCEGLVDDTMATIMAVERALIEKILRITLR